MYRCFHCDQLLALDPELGAAYPSCGAAMVRCPDCGWRGSLRSTPLSCPDCGGVRLRDDHRVLPSLRRRSDGARIVSPEVLELPAGNLPAGQSAAHPLGGALDFLAGNFAAGKSRGI